MHKELEHQFSWLPNSLRPENPNKKTSTLPQLRFTLRGAINQELLKKPKRKKNDANNSMVPSMQSNRINPCIYYYYFITPKKNELQKRKYTQLCVLFKITFQWSNLFQLTKSGSKWDLNLSSAEWGNWTERRSGAASWASVAIASCWKSIPVCCLKFVKKRRERWSQKKLAAASEADWSRGLSLLVESEEEEKEALPVDKR